MAQKATKTRAIRGTNILGAEFIKMITDPQRFSPVQQPEVLIDMIGRLGAEYPRLLKAAAALENLNTAEKLGAKKAAAAPKAGKKAKPKPTKAMPVKKKTRAYNRKPFAISTTADESADLETTA
jgi:hypothetical protein